MIQATPNAGQNFYAFINTPFWLPYSLSTNPKTFQRSRRQQRDQSASAVHFLSGLYVTSNLSDPAIGVLIDGGFWYAPKNLSAFYDSGWNAGSVHSIGVFDPEVPWATTFKYPFVSWSDSGAVTHNITVPAASTTYTANLGAQYQVADFATALRRDAQCDPSIAARRWLLRQRHAADIQRNSVCRLDIHRVQHDLTGTQTPKNLTVNDEIYLTADFNTVATPISVSSLSPASAVAVARVSP